MKKRPGLANLKKLPRRDRLKGFVCKNFLHSHDLARSVAMLIRLVPKSKKQRISGRVLFQKVLLICFLAFLSNFDTKNALFFIILLLLLLSPKITKRAFVH